MNDFKPIPAARISRLQSHISDLGDAKSTDAQIAALFLAYCELKEIEASLPEREAAPSVSLVRRRGGMVLVQEQAALVAEIPAAIADQAQAPAVADMAAPVAAPIAGTAVAPVITASIPDEV